MWILSPTSPFIPPVTDFSVVFSVVADRCICMDKASAKDPRINLSYLKSSNSEACGSCYKYEYFVFCCFITSSLCSVPLLHSNYNKKGATKLFGQWHRTMAPNPIGHLASQFALTHPLQLSNGLLISQLGGSGSQMGTTFQTICEFKEHLWFYTNLEVL